MAKTNKELAIDVAIAYIEAHTKQIVASTANAVIKETTMIDLKSVTNIINSVNNTLTAIDKKGVDEP